MPDLDAFPKSHIVTFKYYVGVINFLEEDYAQVRLPKHPSQPALNKTLIWFPGRRKPHRRPLPLPSQRHPQQRIDPHIPHPNNPAHIPTSPISRSPAPLSTPHHGLHPFNDRHPRRLPLSL